jgi:hypothetical protein
MSLRTLLNPNATAHCSPGACDRGHPYSCQQQWFDLLAQRAAAIQFSLPISRPCLSECCKHRQNGHREKSSLHVASKTDGKMTR